MVGGSPGLAELVSDASLPSSFGRARSLLIDDWRGLAILLVVVGHSIQFTTASFDSNWVFRFIYSFHMPLFFFISGIVAGPAIERPLAGLLKSRVLGLVVPFVSWYVAAAAVTRVLTGRPHLREALHQIYASVDYGLWFLWVLFAMTMIAALCARVPVIPRWLVFLAVWTGLQFVTIGVLGLGLIQWHFAFFACGILLSKKALSGDLLERRWPVWAMVAVVVVWLVLAIGWRRAEPIPAAVWLQARQSLLSPRTLGLAYQYAAAAAGIAASLLFARWVRSVAAAAAGLRFLGLRTLDIYVSHQLILGLFGGVGIVWAPIAAIVAGGGSILLAMAARRFNPVRVLFYGGRRVPAGH